jgi:hypothetical protein
MRSVFNLHKRSVSLFSSTSHSTCFHPPLHWFFPLKHSTGFSSNALRSPSADSPRPWLGSRLLSRHRPMPPPATTRASALGCRCCPLILSPPPATFPAVALDPIIPTKRASTADGSHDSMLFMATISVDALDLGREGSIWAWNPTALRLHLLQPLLTR